MTGSQPSAVPSVKAVSLRVALAVVFGRAACGGRFAGTTAIAGDASSVIASICLAVPASENTQGHEADVWC
jgi:hypothetical protein